MEDIFVPTLGRIIRMIWRARSEWVCWARGDQSEQSLANCVCNKPDLNVGANQRGAPSRLEVDCFHFAGETLISLVYIAFLPVE